MISIVQRVKKMRKDEFPIVDKAIEKAILEERAKWKDKIAQVMNEITLRKYDVAFYEFGGSYTDGKLAAHSYDLEVIRKYCGEAEKEPDRCPVCGRKTSEGKNGGKICFSCVNRKRGLEQ